MRASPVRSLGDERNQRSQVPAPAASTTTGVALLVEDDVELATALADEIEAKGLRTIVAQDGLDALFVLGRETPDVIVIDLEAPTNPGLGLLRLLRDHRTGRRLPTIVLSDLTFQSIKEVMVAGADDLLLKPVSPQRVAERAVVLFEGARSGARHVHA